MMDEKGCDRMYINPFVAGVLATVLAELAALLAVAIYAKHKAARAKQQHLDSVAADLKNRIAQHKAELHD